MNEEIDDIISELNYATIGKIREDHTVYIDRPVLDKAVHKLILWRRKQILAGVIND